MFAEGVYNVLITNNLFSKEKTVLIFVLGT